MNVYNPDKHHRRSIRLEGYDYSQEGLYFITLCCKDRLHLFGHITDGIMHLNPIGEIADSEWLNSPNVRDNIVLHEHIIMPNHLHGIIEITKSKAGKEDNIGFTSPKQTIGSIVRGYKIATIKRIKNYMEEMGGEDKGGKGGKGELQFAPTAPIKIWQRNYYEHIIRDKRAYHNISNYIINNPSKWDKDTFKK